MHTGGGHTGFEENTMTKSKNLKNMHFGYGLDMPQLSNLLMPYSVSKGFDTAMITGLSRKYQHYSMPQTVWNTKNV